LSGSQQGGNSSSRVTVPWIKFSPVQRLVDTISEEKLLDELILMVSRKHKDDWELNSVVEAMKFEVEAFEHWHSTTNQKTASKEASISLEKQQCN